MASAKADAAKEGSERLPRLPSGRHGLSREFVASNQRERITAATIAVVAERGYNETTVSLIAERAGVSRRTFYGFHGSKEESFFAAYELLADHLRESAAAAAASERSWPGRVRARIAAGLSVGAENPDLVRFALIAPPRAGAEVADRYRAASAEAVAELLAGMPKRLAAKKLPPGAELSMLGGGVALIAAKVEAGEGDRLGDLLPDLTRMALTPYLGREEAMRVALAD